MPPGCDAVGITALSSDVSRPLVPLREKERVQRPMTSQASGALRMVGSDPSIQLATVRSGYVYSGTRYVKNVNNIPRAEAKQKTIAAARVAYFIFSTKRCLHTAIKLITCRSINNYFINMGSFSTRHTSHYLVKIRVSTLFSKITNYKPFFNYFVAIVLNKIVCQLDTKISRYILNNITKKIYFFK